MTTSIMVVFRINKSDQSRSRQIVRWHHITSSYHIVDIMTELSQSSKLEQTSLQLIVHFYCEKLCGQKPRPGKGRELIDPPGGLKCKTWGWNLAMGSTSPRQLTACVILITETSQQLQRQINDNVCVTRCRWTGMRWRQNWQNWKLTARHRGTTCEQLWSTIWHPAWRASMKLFVCKT